MREETLAMIPRLGSTAPVSSTLTSSGERYSRPKQPSLSSPAVTILLQDSWHPPQSPTLPSLASPTSNFGRVEKTCCPVRVAKFRGDHESEQRRPYDKYCNEKSWAFFLTSVSPVKKIDRHHWSPTPSSFYMSVCIAFFDGAHPCHFQHYLCHFD